MSTIRHINRHFSVLLSNVRMFSVLPIVHETNLRDQVVKTNIRDFLENEEYSLFAVKAYGYKNSDDVPISESFSSPNSYWFFNWHKQNAQTNDSIPSIKYPGNDNLVKVELKCDSVTACSSATIFEKGYQVLEDYINNKELDPRMALAVKALERLFYAKEKHEQSLSGMFVQREEMRETKMAAILAKHLLSQLLPCPSNYFLSNYLIKNHSTGRPDTCPCGCGVPIHFGLTHIGCPFLFHGYADIVMFPSGKDRFMDVDKSSSAVFTLKKTDDEDYGMINNNDEDVNDIVSGEPKLYSVEESSMRQLCKQAIASSFCKFRQIKDMTYTEIQSSMVPVCAITRDCFEVALYDADFDFLLKSTSLDIFNQHDKSTALELNFPAIVNLWLLINHSLFCSKPNSDTLEALKGTCNLIPQLGKERYDVIVNNSHWRMTPEYFPRHSLTNLKGRESYIDQGFKKYPRKRCC